MDLGKGASTDNLPSTQPSLLKEEDMEEAEGMLIFCQGHAAERASVKNDLIN